jgi:hypothetical protein
MIRRVLHPGQLMAGRSQPSNDVWFRQPRLLAWEWVASLVTITGVAYSLDLTRHNLDRL